METLHERIAHLYRILNHIPCQLVVIDESRNIVYANQLFLDENLLHRENVINKSFDEVMPDNTLYQMLLAVPNTQIMFIREEIFYVQGNIWEDQTVLGAIQLSFPSAIMQSAHALVMGAYDDYDYDIKTIFNTNFDVIYASNGQGITQKVSSACEELWGLKASEMIGRSVYELEREGIYYPSITRLVLETGQRVQAMQQTKTGRKLMVIGTPIMDPEGNITQVINMSRDITSERNMQIEFASIKLLLDAYKHELDQLRSKNLKDDRFVYASNAMENISRMALKVSAVTSTVLLTGESGVGKEVVASFIHSNGKRKEMPFIKINCGAIPESLLESELFGYDKGAFTGASKDGKLGVFELANRGTLFLDEISEISHSMQVKLLRVLQEGTFMRVGGTREITVDVRIIAATNRDLREEVESGRFREDLYYRLNVVPIHIPPLRERPDDILPLTMFFLNRYNKQYEKNKTLDTEVIQQFQGYVWKGNIRELQNIVERLVVLSDKDTIALSDLPAYILGNDSNSGIVIDRIMPLKDALNSVEKQLLQMAIKKYGTTTRAADALGVDQSTISRKLKNS